MRLSRAQAIAALVLLAIIWMIIVYRLLYAA